MDPLAKATNERRELTLEEGMKVDQKVKSVLYNNALMLTCIMIIGFVI